MKRLILLALFALSMHTIKAQNWVPWQHTPPGATTASDGGVTALAEGSLLTVAYNTTSKIEIQQYNGLGWTPLPSPKRFGNFAKDSVRELIRFQGDLYMISHQSLWKFTGQDWSSVHTASSGSYEDIEIFNNQLVFGGFHNVAAVTNLYTYDGAVVGTLPTIPGFIGYITSIHVQGNNLFISAYNNSPLGSGQKGLVKFDGSTWTDAATFLPAGSNYSGIAWQMFELKNRLYLIDIEGISEVRNDSIVLISAFGSSMQSSLMYKSSQVSVINDTAYLGWKYKPAAQAVSDVKAFTGSTLISLPNSPSSITAFQQYQNEILALGPGVSSSVNTLSSMIWSKGTNSGVLSVDLFWDQNANCQKDGTDTTVLNQFISLNNGQVFFASRTNQLLNLAAGTYTIDSVYAYNRFGRHASPSCPWPTTFTVVAGQQTNLELPLSVQPVNDLSIDIAGTRGWRSLYGFREGYIAVVRNLGGNTQNNVNVTINYDQNLSFFGTKPSATTTGPGTVSWTIPQIQPLQQMAFFVELSTNGSFSLSDSLTFIGTVSDQGDVYPRDNKDTTIQSVVGAFDPNDKQVSADRVRPGTKRIDYHIRFQNTGTDTAHKVTVVDSLDWSLPITSIFINSASHPYKFSVQGKVLVWEFDNIMLPDSGADYAGSQGYVRFSAGINPALYVGDTIDNDAEIYFDYQVPVHTNHTKTAVVAWISQPEFSTGNPLFEVFPNPAMNDLHIINHGSEFLSLQIIDGRGRVIDEVRAKPGEPVPYSVTDLSPGLYFIRCDNNTYQIIITN